MQTTLETENLPSLNKQILIYIRLIEENHIMKPFREFLLQFFEDPMPKMKQLHVQTKKLKADTVERTQVICVLFLILAQKMEENKKYLHQKKITHKLWDEVKRVADSRKEIWEETQPLDRTDEIFYGS